MKNKELIKRLLEFPMDAEICVDTYRDYPQRREIVEVGWDDDHKSVWITNYK